MIWADLKRYLALRKPSTGDELVQGIRYYWSTLTPAICKCHRFINHIKKVIPLVVYHNGRATGH